MNNSGNGRGGGGGIVRETGEVEPTEEAQDEEAARLGG